MAGLGRRTRLRARVRRVPRGSLSERGDMSVQLSDEVLVRRALELAGRGMEADPNPRVGAVIVDAAGAVVGEGWHGGAGSPHAEVVALRDAVARLDKRVARLEKRR